MHKEFRNIFLAVLITAGILFFPFDGAKAESGYIGQKKTAVPSAGMPPALPPQAYGIINNALPAGAEKAVPPTTSMASSTAAPATAPMTSVINPANRGAPVTQPMVQQPMAQPVVPAAPMPATPQAQVPVEAEQGDGASTTVAEPAKADPCAAFKTRQGYEACKNQYARIERMKAAKADRDGAAEAKLKAKTEQAAAKDTGDKVQSQSTSGTQGVTDQQIQDAMKALAEKALAASTPDQPVAATPKKP